MRKLTPRGQFVANIVLVLFFGVLLTTMVFGVKAGNDIKKSVPVVQVADDDSTVEIKDVKDVPIVDAPAPLIPMMSSLSVDDSTQPQYQEIIVCQVINGVKHFTNEYKEVA